MAQLYIWNRVTPVTDNYHEEGGIGVLADDISQARAVIAEHVDRLTTCAKERTWDSADADMVLDVIADGDPRVAFIHPDAGCC